ncbi:cytochrome P450 [Podospora conica]|nr:cytochrome P450 [Schizothecium conicum]
MASLLDLFLLALAALALLTALNILHQLLPSLHPPTEPPLVFHWLPLLGSTIPYGRDPPAFLAACRATHGDIFTFVLLGQKTTVYLGPAGNEFILNGRLADLNAEDVYGPLTTPVFGPGVIYDCSNARLMEHKRFVKAGLTRRAMAVYARLIEGEVKAYVKASGELKGGEGVWDVPGAMAEITMFTAARTLQGGEVRRQLTGEMAGLYHDLDMGFQPVNFVAPWLPLPANRRRDVAQKRLRGLYLGIIQARRAREGSGDEEPDMLWTLMRSVYKDGTPMDDGDTASLMVALLLGGQHSSSAAGTWMLLELTARAGLQEELFEEQRRLGGEEGGGFRPLELADVDKMPLMMGAVKETLRVHSSINSIMRRVKNHIPVPGTGYVIPPGRTMLASTSVMHLSEEYYARPEVWDPRRWEGRVEEERDEDMVDYGYGTVNKGTRSPYLPFGAGRHRCIGESFAYLNLCTIMATLVREFRFLPTDDKWVVPPTDYSSMFAMATRPAIVRWERR